MSTFAQDDELTLSFEEKKISEILNYLENEFGVLLSYKDLEYEDKKLSITISGKNKEELLRNIFKALDMDFSMIDENQIVLSSNNGKTSFKCGIIVDDLSSQPLAFANILSSDSLTGLSCDENGIFQLPNDIDATQSFSASYVGYNKSNFTFKDLKECKSADEVLKNPTSYEIEMTIPEFNIPFLIIKEYITDGVDLNQNGFSTRIKPRRLGALPGQVEPDIMKTIQFLPGVTAPSSKASDIYIRGGTPDQNLILWEDIPIYHSAHYFGMISAVDPFVISEMNVFRGGFDASYGGRAAGVIDIKSFGLDQPDSFVGVGSNLINSYLYGHQKFGNKIKNTITFSFRRSFAEAWESPTFKNITRNNQQGLVLGDAEIDNSIENIQINNNFDFFDTHIKFSSQLSQKTRLKVSGIYASNNFDDEIIDDQLMQGQKDTLTLQNLGGSISLEHKWTNKLSTEIKGIYTNYNYNYNFIVQEFQQNNPRIAGVKSNKIIDQQIQFATSYKLPKKQNINAGYQFTNYDIYFNVVEQRNNNNNQVNEAATTKSFLHSAFASYKNPIQNRVGIDAGLRVNYYQASKEFYLEPRIKLSYQLFESLSIHANYGKHHQFIGQTTTFPGSNSGISTPIWRLSEDKSIPIIEAQQVQLGMIFSKHNWVIDFQVYSKEIIGLSSTSYDFENEMFGKPSIGKSNSSGFDILLKKRINKNLKTWISYTYSNIEMSFKEITDDPFPSDFDQRHNFKFSSQYKVNDFQFSAGFLFSSGLPYTIIEDYKVIQQPNAPIVFDITYGKINDQYLNNNLEINLSGQYKFSLPNAKWKGFLSASVTNLLNKKNIYNRSFYIDALPMIPARLRTLDKVNLPATFNCSLRFEI